MVYVKILLKIKGIQQLPVKICCCQRLFANMETVYKSKFKNKKKKTHKM